MANGQVRTITQQLAQDPLGRPLSTPAFGQFFQEQLGREPTQSEVQQFATERGRLGQASRLTVDSNQLAQPAATQQATPSLQSLFGQAPQRTTLQDALSQVQGLLTPLGEAEKQSIREATRLEFAPRIARQKQIGESQQQLFKARAAQAAGGTFGAGERERKGLGSVQQEAQRNLSQLEGLQAAAAEARIAARESTNRKQQTDFIQLADQLQQRSEQAFQNFFKNIISLQKEDRAQQTFQQQLAAPLVAASGLSLVKVGEDGSITEPTPEEIAQKARQLNVDPSLITAAVQERVKELNQMSADKRLADTILKEKEAGIKQTEAQTARTKALTDKTNLSTVTPKTTTFNEALNESASGLVSLRDKGQLSDADYNQAVNALAVTYGINIESADEMGDLRSSLNQAMERAASPIVAPATLGPGPTDNIASDFFGGFAADPFAGIGTGVTTPSFAPGGPIFTTRRPGIFSNIGF